MSARLASALTAVAAIAALIGWGLSNGGASPRPSHPGRPSASPSASVRSPAPHALVPGPGWHLKFASDFSGSHLDLSVWGTCYPWAQPSGCTNQGNHEFEWYRPSQIQLSGGTLRLVAQRLPTAGQDKHGNPLRYGCRSGMVTTYPGFRFQYGMVQVKAQMPSRPGLWPGLWLAPANFQWPPEIDVLEYWTRPVRPAGVFFHPYPAGSRQVYAFPTTSDLSVGWHYFSLQWTPRTLRWFIDGRMVLATRYHIPRQQMYFIADLATGTNPARGGCDGTLRVGYVKIWQRR